MENQRQAAAADAHGRVPTEDRQQAREHHPGPEELPDDYAEWLDGWMFADPDEHQDDEL